MLFGALLIFAPGAGAADNDFQGECTPTDAGSGTCVIDEPMGGNPDVHGTATYERTGDSIEFTLAPTGDLTEIQVCMVVDSGQPNPYIPTAANTCAGSNTSGTERVYLDDSAPIANPFTIDLNEVDGYTSGDDVYFAIHINQKDGEDRTTYIVGGSGGECVPSNSGPTNECEPCVDDTSTQEDECNPCVDDTSTQEDECNPCVDDTSTQEDECNPCVDDTSTQEDECNPCVDDTSTQEDECNPCVDDTSTQEDECNPCVDDPQTRVDECNPPPPCTTNCVPTFTCEQLGTCPPPPPPPPPGPEPSSLTVVKQVAGDAEDIPEDWSFPFTIDNLGGAIPNLTDDQPSFSESVTPGSYTITETDDGDAVLTDIACTGGTVTDETDNSIRVTVTPGDDVTCTFTNTYEAEVLPEVITPQPKPQPRATPPAVQGVQVTRQLPRTGSGSDTMVTAGLGLLVFGAALTLGSRRRLRTVA